MANGILAYEGALPDYVTKAARDALAKAKSTGSSMANVGSKVRDSVTKAAKNALANRAADASFKMGPTPVVKGLLSKEGASYLAGQAAQDAKFAAAGIPEVAKAAGGGLAKGALGGLAATYEVGDALANRLDPSNTKRAMEGANASKFVYGDTALNWPADRVKTPEAVAGENYGKGIVDRAVGSAKGAVQAGANQYSQEAAQGQHPLFQSAPPQQQPQIDPQVAQQQQAHEVESKRQVVEQGAQKQLAQGTLSRPKAAEAVVKADFQRSGEQPTPEQFKTKVAEETIAMKSMDNNELSKYLSYALVAGGLIASFVDKSGDTGRAFSNSFNKQLDRNQENAMFKYKEDAAAKAAAAKAALDERKLANTEAGTQSEIKNRETTTARENIKAQGLLDKWDTDAKMAQSKLDAYNARTASTAATAAGKTSGKAPQGSPIAQKDNIALIKSYASAKGVDLGTGVEESLASQLRQLQKNSPDLTVDEQMEVLLPQFKQTPGKKGMVWDDKPRYDIQQ